jgi:hypothetical protein
MAGRRRAVEYRSEQRCGDLPVVHISVGGRQADGRYRLGRARGVIALGDVAIGLVAVGGVAIGLFSVGGVAIGLVALGGVAVGFVAVGAVSVGLLAVGAVALGLTAVGTLTALVGPAYGHRLGAAARELAAEDGPGAGPARPPQSADGARPARGLRG